MESLFPSFKFLVKGIIVYLLVVNWKKKKYSCLQKSNAEYIF
ncbi:hypothetical protein ABID22_003541 [Pontibacter aydingkolensis]